MQLFNEPREVVDEPGATDLKFPDAGVEFRITFLIRGCIVFI